MQPISDCSQRSSGILMRQGSCFVRTRRSTHEARAGRMGKPSGLVDDSKATTYPDLRRSHSTHTAENN